MPRCEICEESVPSGDLKPVGPDGLIACTGCRRPKETEMADDKRKKVGSFHIYEVPTEDGAVDHEVEADVAYSGLEVKFKTTFDKIRAFFTEKREKGQKAELKAVK
jgi:hypothetical protein